MKTVGFGIEHDSDKVKPEILDNNQVLLSRVSSSEEVSRIINYLQNGSTLFSITQALLDHEHKYIDSYKIFSDGEWIWPSHLGFYFLKSKRLNSDFLVHMQLSGYLQSKLDEKQFRMASEFLFMKVLNVKYPRRK